MVQKSKVLASYRVDWRQHGVVHITDLNAGRSVTNDADAVVTEITTRYGKNVRIQYVDTAGRTDELVHVNGRFTCFGPLAQDIFVNA
jgi:hypothetical protein